MGKPGPETKLVKKMREAGAKKYGEDLVDVKYHGDMYGEAGVSDLLMSLFGVFTAVEVKAPESYPVKGKPSVERALREGPTQKQRIFVDRVNASGGEAGFAATIEQYLDILARAERRVHHG